MDGMDGGLKGKEANRVSHRVYIAHIYPITCASPTSQYTARIWTNKESKIQSNAPPLYMFHLFFKKCAIYTRWDNYKHKHVLDYQDYLARFAAASHLTPHTSHTDLDGSRSESYGRPHNTLNNALRTHQNQSFFLISQALGRMHIVGALIVP